MKNYYEKLGMSLFCSTFLTYVCVLLGLRVISLRLIFQYDVLFQYDVIVGEFL